MTATTKHEAIHGNRRQLMVAALLGATLLAAACSSTKSQSQTANGPTTGAGTSEASARSITFELSRTYSPAPVTVAITDGTFARFGLTVTTVPYDPATSVPLILQGQAQVGYGGLGAILLAISKGIPLTIIAGTAINGATDSESLTGVLVKARSGIASFKDLAGKTVGLNALRNDAQADVQSKIDAAGGDSTKTKFVAVPFPGMASALSAGRVDAVASAAPFVQAIQAAGNLNIGPYTGPGYPSGVYFVSNDYLTKNRSVVDAFRSALRAEYDKVNKDRKPVINVMVNDYKTPIGAAESIPRAHWNVTVAADVYQQALVVLKKYKIITADVDLKTAVLN